MSVAEVGALILFISLLLAVEAKSDLGAVLEEPVSRTVDKPQILEHKCRKFDRDILRHLGTKTPYRIVANDNESPLSYEGCEAIRIAGVVRHGTRTPGVKDAERMRTTLGKIRDHLASYTIQDAQFNGGTSGDSICQYELDRILSWNLKLESEDGKTLTREGEDEMFKLAKRLQKRYPKIMPRSYSNTSYAFKFTQTQRTQGSANYFTSGLFGAGVSKEVWFPQPLDKDPILRFYKLCDRWKNDVKDNKASKTELNLHKESAEAVTMVRKMSDHLRLNYTLTYDEVNLMYVTCAFEVAWHKESKSPWCAVFTKNDVEVLEYGEELKYYWKDGYGFPVNYEQACVLTRDIFDYFSSADKENKAMFYFTHSGTVLKLLSNLGLYKDDFSLTHNLPVHMKNDRKWKISYIDAFGSNVVFILYRCSDGMKVLTLHQERAVWISGCPQHDLCPLETIRRVLGADSSCNFTAICSTDSHSEL